MKRAYLLVEHPIDADLLRRVLPADAQQDVEIVVANGSPDSLARSLLVMRRVPVAVVVDSHSPEPTHTEELRQNTEDFIRLVAARIPVKVIAVAPALESFFFAAPEVIERVLGQPVPEDFVILGQRDPKGVLHLLSTRAKQKWDMQKAIDAMEDDDVERIRRLDAIQELTAFLQSPTAVTPVAAH